MLSSTKGVKIRQKVVPYSVLFHQVYYDWKFKDQHAKILENIAGAKRYSHLRGLNIAGVSAPVAPSIPMQLYSLLAALCDRNPLENYGRDI